LMVFFVCLARFPSDIRGVVDVMPSFFYERRLLGGPVGIGGALRIVQN